MITLDEALSTGYGIWRTFTCPVHDDSDPSARVNSETGYWVCMSCGAKGKAENVTFDARAAARSLLRSLDATVRPKPESWLDQFDTGDVHPYWLGRFSEQTCRLYRLGYDTTKGKPCYPIRDQEGYPLGVVHRSLDPEGVKYRYPYGVVTSRLLFGAHEVIDPQSLVLVEGATDVMACREMGIEAVGAYGSQLHRQQVDQIQWGSPKKVVVAFDMDRAGRGGGEEAVRLLRSCGVNAVRATWDIDLGKDVGEMNPETRSEILSQALAPTQSI